MRRLVLHLIVALLAFFVGVTAAMLPGGFDRGSGRDGRRFKVHVDHFEHHGPPPTKRGCTRSLELEELPPPPPPAVFEAPEAPPPPPPATEIGPYREKRIHIRRADGSTRVSVQRIEEVR